MSTKRKGRPLSEGESLFTPGAAGLRRLVEQRTATFLLFLHHLPRWALPVALATLLITGFLVTGWVGALALLAVAAFLGWFGYLSWPSVGIPGRLLRLAALVVLIALAIDRM